MKVAILTTDNRDDRGDFESPVPYFGSAPSALLKGFEYCPGVEVHVVSCIHRKVKAPAQLAQNIFFHSLVVPKAGWMRTFYQRCIRAVRAKLRELAPDIVHGQGTERDCALSAVFSGYPNVVTTHGNMVEVAQALGARFLSFHWFAARLETIALGRTAGVLCNSKHTQRLVAPRARRTWAVPNALQGCYFESPPSPRRGPPAVLLHVGAINRNKQPLEVLGIAERLHAAGIRFRIDFIGEPDNSSYAQTFFGRIRLMESQGYVRYVGKLDTAGLIEAYDHAHALIHTPQSEAFGLVVAEALARNTKVFAFRSGGIVDIVDGVPGAVTCLPGDWEGLGASLQAWIKQGAPNEENTAAVMKSRYLPVAVAKRHLEIYREVLALGNRSLKN